MQRSSMDDSPPFVNDLCCFDSDLLRYPQRSVEVGLAGTFLLNQDMGAVGTLVFLF